jgi:hypothetical protein
MSRRVFAPGIGKLARITQLPTLMCIPHIEADGELVITWSEPTLPPARRDRQLADRSHPPCSTMPSERSAAGPINTCCRSVRIGNGTHAPRPGPTSPTDIARHRFDEGIRPRMPDYGCAMSVRQNLLTR